jgi:hypothetical protein
MGLIVGMVVGPPSKPSTRGTIHGIRGRGPLPLKIRQAEARLTRERFVHR